MHACFVCMLCVGCEHAVRAWRTWYLRHACMHAIRAVACVVHGKGLCYTWPTMEKDLPEPVCP